MMILIYIIIILPQHPEFRLQSFIPPDLHTQMPECGDQCGVGFHRVAVTMFVVDFPNVEKYKKDIKQVFFAVILGI